MATALDNLIAGVVGSMKSGEAGSDGALQARMAKVLPALLRTLAEIDLQESELAAVLAFFNRVSETGEWRFLTHVFGVETLVTELTHGGADRRTVDNVEGPLYLPGSPEVATPARLMRKDEAGRRLFLDGRVMDAATGKGIADAEIDVWQSNAVGAYAEDDPSQPEWNFRRRVKVDEAGRYAIETVIPGCYEVGDLSGMACGELMRALGRHGMRPGHIHFRISASGMQSLTAMLYFEDDPWISDDCIFSVRNEIVLRPTLHETEKDFATRDAKAPFFSSTFDFGLEPVAGKVAA